jgi:hypothetical protein
MSEDMKEELNKERLNKSYKTVKNKMFEMKGIRLPGKIPSLHGKLKF